MFPENVAQKRRCFGHEPFATHVAQVSSLPGVQRLVAARRRYQLVEWLVVVVVLLQVLAVLVRVHVVVAVIVVAAGRRLAAVVVGAAETAATAADAIPDHLCAAAHDRGGGGGGRRRGVATSTGRGELLELRSAADDPAQQRRGRWLGHGELAVSPPEPVRGLRFRPESGICDNKNAQRSIL